MALVDMLLPEFDHEMATTRKLLERVPDDRLAWKPHAKSFTLGQLAQHVATIPMWGTMTLDAARSWILPATPAVRRPAAAPRSSSCSTSNAAKARTELTGKTDAELMAPVGAETRRRHHLLDAQGQRVAQLRDEPPGPSPRRS